MNKNTIQGQIIRPFSPAIGKYKLPDQTVNLINQHVDEILKDQNEINKFVKGVDINIPKIFDVVNSMNSKKSFGGTSTKNVKRMITKYKKNLK